MVDHNKEAYQNDLDKCGSFVRIRDCMNKHIKHCNGDAEKIRSIYAYAFTKDCNLISTIPHEHQTPYMIDVIAGSCHYSLHHCNPELIKREHRFGVMLKEAKGRLKVNDLIKDLPSAKNIAKKPKSAELFNRYLRIYLLSESNNIDMNILRDRFEAYIKSTFITELEAALKFVTKIEPEHMDTLETMIECFDEQEGIAGSEVLEALKERYADLKTNSMTIHAEPSRSRSASQFFNGL